MVFKHLKPFFSGGGAFRGLHEHHVGLYFLSENIVVKENFTYKFEMYKVNISSISERLLLRYPIYISRKVSTKISDISRKV